MGAPAAPRYDPGDTETEDTVVEIGQTRVKMGGTVDTIRPRPDSEALTEQVKDRVHDVADHAPTERPTGLRRLGGLGSSGRRGC